MKKETLKFETQTRYDGRTNESYENGGDLTGRMFNDVISMLRSWIRENHLKMDDIHDIYIAMSDEKWENRFTFRYDCDKVVSQKIDVQGQNPIGIEDFIRKHWDVDQQ